MDCGIVSLEILGWLMLNFDNNMLVLTDMCALKELSSRDGWALRFEGLLVGF